VSLEGLHRLVVGRSSPVAGGEAEKNDGEWQLKLAKWQVQSLLEKTESGARDAPPRDEDIADSSAVDPHF
jgi:hypothetical protein